MSQLIVISAFLLVGAAVCTVAFMFRGDLALGWRLRRATLKRAEASQQMPTEVEETHDAQTEVSLESADAVSDAPQDEIPLSWPIRIVATMASVLLLLLLNSTRAYAGLSPLPDEYFWQAYAASCLMIAWYLTHVWCYAVRIQGSSLTVPGVWFGSRSFDLSTLQHVEEDGRHVVRLYFKCGACAKLTKHLNGYSQLRNKLSGDPRMAVA